jgi:hypothetical protein
MSDLERVIEKALLAASVDDQGVPDIDDQVRLVAQALTASGYGGFEVVRSEASQPVLPGELVEAVREQSALLDDFMVIACERDYVPDADMIARVHKTRAALATLPDPLPTVESVRAEYLAELTKRADDQCAKITDSSPLIVREALNASCWLRSQKDTTHDQ